MQAHGQGGAAGGGNYGQGFLSQGRRPGQALGKDGRGGWAGKRVGADSIRWREANRWDQHGLAVSTACPGRGPGPPLLVDAWPGRGARLPGLVAQAGDYLTTRAEGDQGTRDQPQVPATLHGASSDRQGGNHPHYQRAIRGRVDVPQRIFRPVALVGAQPRKSTIDGTRFRQTDLYPTRLGQAGLSVYFGLVNKLRLTLNGWSMRP